MRLFLICITMSVLLCGCSLLTKEPYRPVNYYDLNCSTDRHDKANLVVAEVSSDRPYQERMVFRVSGNRLEIDEFNRWSGRPSVLAQKYFTMTFEGGAPRKEAELSLSAEILELEADIQKRSVRLSMLVILSSEKDSRVVLRKVYRQEVPVEKVTGESFAKGFESAIDKMSDEILKDLAGMK